MNPLQGFTLRVLASRSSVVAYIKLIRGIPWLLMAECSSWSMSILSVLILGYPMPVPHWLGKHKRTKDVYEIVDLASSTLVSCQRWERSSSGMFTAVIMKTVIFSLLAFGLSSVLAAPAPTAGGLELALAIKKSPYWHDIDDELAMRATCTISCPSGQFAQYNSSTKKCKCVAINEEYCLRETICIGTHYAVFDSKNKTCSCQPYDFVAEEKCLQEQICIATHFAYFDSKTRKCSCKAYDFAGEEKCLKEQICIGTHYAVWNPKTSTCSCQPAVFETDPETICKTATDCISGSLPVWWVNCHTVFVLYHAHFRDHVYQSTQTDRNIGIPKQRNASVSHNQPRRKTSAC